MASPNVNMVDDGGDTPGGSSGSPWLMYRAETQKLDKEMVEEWKGEADKALIFAGLFSAVVAVSIVESYKWLSPDPGNETVKLLTQISQQLVNISNGIPLESIAAESQSFKPSKTVVLINVTWFGSIVLCLASSVFGTLIQHWSRRYLELTQGSGAPHERARLRMFMFNGLKRFKMDRLLVVLPLSLHASILLYCVGIVSYIFSINANIAFFALGYLLYFYLAYATATVLPCLFFDCPYTTPLSKPAWHLSNIFLCGIFSTTRRIVDLALSALGPSTNQQTSRSHGPARWREILEKWVKMLDQRVNKHRRWFSDGLQRSVELCATEAPKAVDANALEWTLTAIVEDKEFENFAVSMPGFLDPYAQSGAEDILPLSDQPPTDPVFGFRLHHLLNTFISGTSTLTEEERRRLRMCLKCLWCWMKAYNQNPEPLPPYFPLPSPNMTLHLPTEQDPTAGIIGRCFGALVARKLAADVSLPHSSGVLHDAKLAYLSAIPGSTSAEFLGHPGAIGLANIVSLTSSTFNLVTEKVPSEVLDIFRTTVDILTEDCLTLMNAELPADLVANFFRTYLNARQLHAPDWLMDQLGRISDKLSIVGDAQPAGDDHFGHV